VDALLVAQLGQVLLREGEDLALVHATELGVHLEVLLVQGLQARIQQAREQGVLHLFDHLGARLLRIVLRDHGA